MSRQFPEVITLIGREQKYYEIIKKTSFLTVNLYELKYYKKDRDFYLYTDLTIDELYHKKNIEILNVWDKLYKLSPVNKIDIGFKMGLA